MKPDEFETLRSQAAELYAKQPAKDKNKVSVDAIFVSLAISGAQAETAEPRAKGKGYRRATSEDAPADWFVETLKKLKGTGEAVTAGRFLLLAGRFPATRMDSINTVRWLREAGYTPRRAGGQQLFDL